MYSQNDEIDNFKNQDDLLLENKSIIMDSGGMSEFLDSNSSLLNSVVSIYAVDAQLNVILKELSSKTNANFVYEDELININNISISIKDQPLQKVLQEILGKYSIGFYEYSPGTIALGKKLKFDNKTATIKGVVRDESKEPLIGASITIKELGIGDITDTKGNYLIKKIKPGTYNLLISFVGYESIIQKIILNGGDFLEFNFVLKSISFQIGGIEVIGQKDLLPTDVSTKTTITSGEIEHYQASSIGDVLDLVPGIQKTENPGLGKTSQVSVRGDDNDPLNKFGTLIILDGAPISNNSNLQFEKLTGSKFGNNTMGSGLDLRTIPADNIESIEVITGLPSVRYGDVTSGVINVQTKIGSQPNRFKFKNNPDTREANFGGGIVISNSGLSYNFNVAQSERDIRLTGDEYTRITGQIVYSNNLYDNSLLLNNKLMFQKILDEEEPKGDMQKTKNYNRGFTSTYSIWGKYKPEDDVSVLDFNFFTTMRNENSMKSRLKSGYVISPTGDTLSNYIGKVETKGIEWTVGGRLEYSKIFYTGDFVHKVLFGTDPQYNANTGEGVMFDTVFNYYGVESGRRPYKFDDIPGQFLVNLYFEDKLTGHFIFDFNLLVGFRYEMYRPYNFNLKGIWGDGNLVQSRQGTSFNPRLNMMIYFSEFNQLRLSAGTSSKSPPMSIIYPPEDVFRWRNPATNTIEYLRYNLWTPELKGYRETIYEASYDHKFFDFIGATLSAYYKERKNEYESWPIPQFRSTVTNSKIYVDIIDASFGELKNTGQTISKGLEFAIRTSRIQPLNMEFQITGSYNFIKNPSTTIFYSQNPNLGWGQVHNYKVPYAPIDTLIGWIYPSSGSWNDRLQINYYIKYTLPSIGLWITLRAENVLFQKRQTFQLAPVVLDSLNDTEKQSRDFDLSTKKEPQKWLFNLSMSKSLFKGAEVSFYVNNFIDDPAIWRSQSTLTSFTDTKRNPDLFYGIEFSMSIDHFFE
jgi:hypothetical protein